jgi:hypothetical protein
MGLVERLKEMIISHAHEIKWAVPEKPDDIAMPEPPHTIYTLYYTPMATPWRKFIVGVYRWITKEGVVTHNLQITHIDDDDMDTNIVLTPDEYVILVNEIDAVLQDEVGAITRILARL